MKKIPPDFSSDIADRLMFRSVLAKGLPMKKVLFLELNEFQAEVLEAGAKKLKLKNLERLVSLPRSTSWTEDTYESDFLEPWVQWVSVHTGVPSSKHQIKHLGDVPHLEDKQIWEHLSDRGISSGIWGPMNASRRDAKLCRFFIPDPWTASEDAYPEELNCLLDPVRYLSKNYLNRSTGVLLQKVGRLLKLLFAKGLGGTLLKELLKLPKHLYQHGFEHFVFISLADYLSTMLFLEYRKREKPDFCLLFLNSIAHLQHHHWHDLNLQGHEPLAYGLRYMDRILGHLFDSLGKEEVFVATNAFSQKNTNDEKPWILYRQVDQAAFLKTVGVPCTKVEPHMTHDAHLFFPHAKGAEEAKALLAGAKIGDAPLFLVESYPQEPTKLFYRVCFTDAIDPETQFTLGGKSHRFYDLFYPIVQRTGKHIPEGTIFCNHHILPPRIKNHELLNTLFAI